ncbi:LytTR family DNA-binding domain-containing protein [Ruminococcaceae bacterium OttesenSCG-928-I18]|nr:LytTR family DNA-binding domain-containing protein [Ruminococcaceae bacterium OttesenSCG-928-I18]
MLSIAVCEDQKKEAEQLQKMLALYQERRLHLQIQVELFYSAEDLMAAVEGGKQYQLYLLDIIMPGMNGISLARTLYANEEHPAIIFITTSRDYAVEAFSVRAMDYLVKPIEQVHLYEAIDNAVTRLGNRIDTYTVIHASGKDHRVKTSEIVCVEVMGHSLCYYLSGGEKIISKVLRISFEQATEDLVKDMQFIRPHRSFLINAAYVKKFSKAELLMENGMRIPVSRLRFPQVKQEYLHFLQQMNKT